MNKQLVFISACKNNKFSFLQNFYEENKEEIDIHYNKENAFRIACEYDNINIAK